MLNYQLFITLLISSLIGSNVDCVKDSGELRPEKLGKEFKELDKLLTKRTSSDNAIENMKIVDKLIPQAESSNFMGFKNKKNLAKAERLFKSLTKLEDEKMCNRNGFKISTDNSKALKKAGTPKRVGEVFAYYIELQQDVCLRVFPAILKRKLASMDQDKLRRLDYVMEKSMNKDKGGRIDASGLFSLIRMNHVGPSIENLNKTLRFLVQDIGNDLELKKGVESEALVANRYFIEPCDHFILNLAEDMFALASTWIPIHTPDNNEYEFYHNWARYKFCSNMYRVINSLKVAAQSVN